MIRMTSKITDILQKLIKEKIITLESRSWVDDVFDEAIYEYKQEKPIDKKKIENIITIRNIMRERRLYELEESSNEFK